MVGQMTPHVENSTRDRKTMRFSFILLLAVFVFLAAFITGCGKKEEKAKAEKIINVKVSVADKKSIRPFIEAVGNLNPNEEVTISSEVDGIMKSIKVDEGTLLSQGMVLAEVNETDYRLNVEGAEATLRQAEANLANMKTEYERKQALLKEELITKQQFDDLSTRLAVSREDVDRAKANLSLARERLGKTIIYSPIKASVKKKMVTAGDFVRASQPIMSIIQIDPLKLSFTVAEKDLGALKQGQDVTFTVDPFPGKEFKGRLTVIYPSLDEQSRTLKVEALVPNSTLQLKPGLFARVKLYTGAPRLSVTIPVTSILYEGTKTKVYILEGDKAQERFVKIGDKYGDMIDIIEGLQGGEQLVVVGQNILAQGSRVNVVK